MEFRVRRHRVQLKFAVAIVCKFRAPHIWLIAFFVAHVLDSRCEKPPFEDAAPLASFKSEFMSAKYVEKIAGVKA
jgi:hypothetical protein